MFGISETSGEYYETFVTRQWTVNKHGQVCTQWPFVCRKIRFQSQCYDEYIFIESIHNGNLTFYQFHQLKSIKLDRNAAGVIYPTILQFIICHSNDRLYGIICRGGIAIVWILFHNSWRRQIHYYLNLSVEF